MELSLEALSGGKDAVIAKMLEHPAVKSGDVGQGMKAAVAAVQENIVATCSPAVHEALQDCYEMHCLTWGDPDDLTDDNADEWHEALDAAVDEALQPWTVAVSAEWLANNTTDTRLHEQDAVDTLARKTGEQIYKQLKGKLTDAQVLSAVGVVKDDVAQALAGMSNDIEGIGQQCQAIFMRYVETAELVGKPTDEVLREEIDLVSGSEPVLAGSAMARMGLEPADVAVLQGARSALRLGGLDALFAMCKLCFEPPMPGEMPPIPNQFKRDPNDAPKAKPKRKAKAKAAEPEEGGEPAEATDAPQAAGEMPTRALQLLVAHANVNDKEMAEMLGMSRPAFNNARNGKGKKPISDPTQIAMVRQTLHEHATGLIEAINLIDAATKAAGDDLV